ncbi:MAG: PorT family protein [Acidobacteria bacterium]|nr:PorT family protein [Acidobacteriota bacterium]
MKKLMIVSLAVLFVAALVPQNLAAGVGIKGGFNFSNISFKPAEQFPEMPDFQDMRGLTGGLFFSLNLGFIGIQPEILYSRRGMMYELDTENKLEYMADYIEGLVLVKLSILPVGPIRPVIFGGPSYGYLLKATGRMTTPEGTEVADVADMFEKTEWAAVFGAGLDFKLAGILLTVDGRYHMGLTNISTEVEVGQTVKNKGFSVLVGIGF